MQIASPTDHRLLRALVAEDDAGVRHLIASMLVLDGWEVREAGDGVQALAIAEDWHPDAVVIDVMMPNKDGLTAVRELRSMDGGDDVGVVVVSAKAGVEEAARAAGSDDFMAKPFDPDELTARARASLRWRPAAADEPVPERP